MEIYKGVRILMRLPWPTGYMDDKVRRYGLMFKIGSESASQLVYFGEPDVV